MFWSASLGAYIQWHLCENWNTSEGGASPTSTSGGGSGDRSPKMSSSESSHTAESESDTLAAMSLHEPQMAILRQPQMSLCGLALAETYGAKPKPAVEVAVPIHAAKVVGGG